MIIGWLELDANMKTIYRKRYSWLQPNWSGRGTGSAEYTVRTSREAG